MSMRSRKVVLQVGRWNGPPKSKSQRIPDGLRGWTYTLKGLKRRVPFQLQDLLQSVRRGETVYVCEGEKDCLSLYQLKGLDDQRGTGDAAKGATLRRMAVGIWARTSSEVRSVSS